MNKLKENFKQLLGNQKEILKKYNLTFILIACITIFMILGDFRSEHIEKIRTTLILTNILFFVIEALLDFKWYRIIGYIIAFVISIISKSFIYRENFTTKQELFIAGFYFSTVILAIYKIIKVIQKYRYKFILKSRDSSIWILHDSSRNIMLIKCEE